jgi:hypothetical protein
MVAAPFLSPTAEEPPITNKEAAAYRELLQSPITKQRRSAAQGKRCISTSSAKSAQLNEQWHECGSLLLYLGRRIS